MIPTDPSSISAPPCSARDALMRCYNADTRLFRDKQFMCEDLQITSSLSRDGKVAYIPDVTLSYSVGKPSVMSRGNMEKTFRFYMSTIKLLHYIQEQNDIPNASLATQYSDRLHFIMTQAFRLRNREMRDEVMEWYKRTDTHLRVKTRVFAAIVNQ